jgi:CBS domain-containing protein
MEVREGMSSVVLTIGPEHTLRDAARSMAERKVGAAVVLDPEQPGPGIITERDLLESIGAGQSPDTERVCDHLSANLTFAEPSWSLEQAA